MKVTLADIYPERQPTKITSIGLGSVVLIGNDKEPYELVSAGKSEVVLVGFADRGIRWSESVCVADVRALTGTEARALVGSRSFHEVLYIGQAVDVVHVDIPND